MSRLARLWWTTLPLAARRLSYTVAGALTDGYFLVSFPRLAAMATPLAAVAGLLVGWWAPGYDLVVFESLLAVSLLIVIGSWSAHFGLVFTAGFAVGDFFLHFNELKTPPALLSSFQDTVDHLIWFRIPLLSVYLVMGLVTVLLPLLAKGLTAGVIVGPRRARFVVAMVLHAVISGGYMFLWSQSYPVLIRPVFTWGGATPPVFAIEPVQANGLVLAAVAVAGSLARLGLQRAAMSSPVRRARQDLYADDLLRAGPVRSLHQRSRPPIRALASSALLTFLLAGAFSDWIDAAAVGGLALVLALIRNGVTPLGLEPLARLTARVPLLVRFVGGLAATMAFAYWVIGDQMEHLGTFRPVLVVTAFSLVLFFLLNPSTVSESEDLP